MQIGITQIRSKTTGKSGALRGVLINNEGKTVYQVAFGALKVAYPAENCEIVSPLPVRDNLIHLHIRMIQMTSKPERWKELAENIADGNGSRDDAAMIRFLLGNTAAVFKRHDVRVISVKDLMSELKPAGINISEDSLNKILRENRQKFREFYRDWQHTDITYDGDEDVEDLTELMEAA